GPARRYRLFTAADTPSGIVIELIEPHEAEGPGAWRVEVSGVDLPTHTILEQVGRTPLPPYILAQRKIRQEEPGDAYDRAHYQTIYAASHEPGSVAAPTAGLHFTPGVMDSLAARGVETTRVTLHVGAGTFKPVETEMLGDHPMHHEWCALGEAAAHFPPLPPTSSDRRVIAVGSTSARTLESYAALHEAAPEASLPERHSTDILIAPGYRWRWVDGMVTNFHLPRSTLLAMVAAMLEIPGKTSGIERVHGIYREAIERRYRFYSYGDAMLILP
ncbi:MAG: S-adenosylmethionine:tRNA ribosyltransferase-isomerase, partial [Phycisphaerales bacterium]